MFQDKEEEHVACACVGTGASFLLANKQYHDFSYDLYIYIYILYYMTARSTFTCVCISQISIQIVRRF